MAARVLEGILARTTIIRRHPGWRVAHEHRMRHSDSISAGCPGSARNGERQAAEPVKSAAEIEQLGDEQSTATPTPIGPKQWFCLFRGDAGPMAVPVESVAEVLETDTLVPLAWSPPQVVGMCSYHREVVPVVKLGPLPHDVGEEVPSGQDQTAAIDTAGAMAGNAGPARCVVLILKTEHVRWGIRVDSENTIMSWESPHWHSPRISTNRPVLIGIVRLAGTSYRIVDAEATLACFAHGGRSVVWTH